MLNFLFTKVLFMSLAGGAAILLLRLLALFTRRAFSCRWNYYIWLLAVGILLFPLSMPSRSQSLVPARTAAVQQQVPAAAAAGAHDTAQQAAEDGAVTGAQNRISGQTVSQAENNGEAAEARPITAVSDNTAGANALRALWHGARSSLPWLWLTGFLFFFLCHLLRRVRFGRRMRSLAVSPSAEQEAALAEAAAALGMRRPPRLLAFDAASSPFIAGLFRPVVYIPRSAADRDALLLVFRHELTHCRRGDLLYKLLMELVCALHFFNPLVWYMRREADRFCELSCDEQVADGMDAETRKRYSLMLLTQTQQQRLNLRGGAALFERRTNLKERIEILMLQRRVKRFTMLISVLLTLSLGVSFFLFASLVNAQNSTTLTQFIYSGNLDYAAIYSKNNEYPFDDIRPAVDSDSIFTYTKFAGQPRLEASFIDENGNYFALRLTRVLRTYAMGHALEGTFTLTRNGEAVFEDQSGHVTDLPPRMDPIARTEVNVGFSVNGVSTRFQCTGQLQPADSAWFTSARMKRAEAKRTSDFREVYTGELLESTVGGQSISAEAIAAWNAGTAANPETIAYSAEGQYAEAPVLCFSAADPPVYVRLYTHGHQSVSNDSVSGMFLVRTDGVDTDSFTGTLSGLSGIPGGVAELKSDDGAYLWRARIAEPPGPEPLEVYGTGGAPEQYDTEGEDVFIGTPYEQDQFEREEHNRLYKRIVVDENNNVMLVVPAEYQQGEALNVEKDGSYDLSMNWENMLGRSYVINADGTILRRAILLQDPDTWWYKAVIPLENQYWEFKEEPQVPSISGADANS